MTSGSVAGESFAAEGTFELRSDDDEPGMQRLGRWDGTASLAEGTARAQSLRQGHRAEYLGGREKVSKIGPAHAGLSRPW